MATIEDALTTYILTLSAVTAYVGSDVFDTELPDGYEDLVTDYIVHWIVSPENTTQSFGDKTSAEPLIQIDIWSKSKASALAIGNLLVTALYGYSGTLATGLVVTATESISGPKVIKDTTNGTWWHGIVEWKPEYTR